MNAIPSKILILCRAACPRDPWKFGGQQGRELRALLNRRGYLFATSANRTGDAPVGSAAEVDALFQSRMLVVEVEAGHEQPRAVSGMIVKVNDGPVTELVRPGFQNEEAGISADDYIAQQPNLWRTHATDQGGEK